MPASIRATNLARLEKAGFRVADSLPTKRDERGALRPVMEMAARLVALGAVYVWVAAPEKAVPARRVKKLLADAQVRRSLTPKEKAVVALARGEANDEHADTIGWRLENMWPLAWVLGFAAVPPCDGAMIKREVIQDIVQDFLDLARVTPADLVATGGARSYAEVDAMEDLFYCAHNAARSAQLGGKTVPQGFDPMAGGGVIHERRHALTWCLSPKTKWEDTDLST